MVNQQLLDYIEGRQGQNIPASEIEKVLLETGWQKSDIDEAFKALSTPPTPVVLAPPVLGFTEFLGPFQLLSESWKIYKERFWKFIGILAIPVVIQVVVGIIAFAVLMFLGIGSFISLASPNKINPSGFLQTILSKPGPMLILFFVFLVFFSLVLIYFQIWGQIAFLTEAVIEDNISIKEAYRSSRKKIGKYLWLSFVSGMIILGGFLLLVIPGIIWLVEFFFASWVLVVEDISGHKALVKSREYVKGYWWKVFGRILFLTLICFAFSAISSLFNKYFGSLKLPLLKGFISLVFSLGYLLLSPLTTIYIASMFKSLKAVKR